MAVLSWRRTGDIVRDLETYLAHEREIGVWGFPHFVRYLQAIIVKLTPQPHRCTEAVLDAAAVHDDAAAYTSEDASKTRAVVSREAANAICEVVGCWAGWDGTNRAKHRDGHGYEQAKAVVRGIESAALDVGLTVNDLMECAVDAHGAEEIDANRRDAAIAAMSAGHFKLAHEIATDAPRDKN